LEQERKEQEMVSLSGLFAVVIAAILVVMLIVAIVAAIYYFMRERDK
jgi:hypothetical protein